MFKQEYYIKASEVFGCSIGVANTITYRTKEETREEFDVEAFKRLDDEVGINNIILDSIEEGSYQQLRREILVGERTKNKRLKEVTLYKRAYGKTNTKS
jgi:hypothetical protein